MGQGVYHTYDSNPTNKGFALAALVIFILVIGIALLISWQNKQFPTFLKSKDSNQSRLTQLPSFQPTPTIKTLSMEQLIEDLDNQIKTTDQEFVSIDESLNDKPDNLSL